MKLKVFLAIILSLVLAYFTRTFIGLWLAENYAYSGSFIGFGKGENLDGALLAYTFFSSLLVSVISNSIKRGLSAAILVTVLYIVLGAFNPQLWMDLILLALGLGLAWLILFLKRKQAG